MILILKNRQRCPGIILKEMRPQEIMDIDELFWKIHDGTDKQLVHLKALHGCYWRTCSCINCQISLLPLGFSPLFFSILTFTLVIRHLTEE